MEFMKLDIQFFATAFAEATNDTLRSTSNPKNKGTLYASLTEIAPTEDEKLKNQSRVTCYCKFTQVTGSYTQYAAPYLRLYWFDNNENKKGKEIAKVQVHTINYGSYDKVEELTATITVNHLDDGTLKGYVQAKWEYDGSGQLPCKTGYATTTNTTLYEIPRANKITECLDTDIEDTPIIKLTQNSPDFTTKVSYRFGNLTDVIKENWIEETIEDWTIPKSFYGEIPNDPEGECTLIVSTFNGDKQIDVDQEFKFKVKVNEEKNRPTAEIWAEALEELNATTYPLTGDINKVVKGYSNVSCSFTGKSKNGATITSVTINEMEVFFDTHQPDEGTEEDVTQIGAGEYTIDNAATNIFEIVVTDSRGFTNIEEIDEVELIDYFKPTISDTFFKRNSPTDGKVNLTYEGSFFNRSFGVVSNELKLYYSYKLKNDSNYCDWKEFEDADIEIEDNSYKGVFKLTEEFNYKNIYNMRFTMSDALTSPGQIVYLETISKGKPVLWWDEEGVYTTEEFYKENQETGEYEKIVSENIIGKLSDLTTTDISSIVAAINSVNEKISNKVLLFNGVASAGNVIQLNDDYTKYNTLHVITGNDTQDFGSALTGSTIATNNEIDVGKVWCNSSGQLQIHTAVFSVTDSKTLKLNSAYFQRTANAGTQGLANPTTCYVRRIYGVI